MVSMLFSSWRPDRWADLGAAALLRSLWPLVALVVSGLSTCPSGGAADGGPGEAKYVFVWLKTGPSGAEKTAEERQKIFAGHMANIQRLSDEGSLLIAGPFDAPHDPAWRGIFVMNVPTENEASALVATDPGVQAGVFVADLRPMNAPAALREVPRIHREITAGDNEPPKPGEMPKSLRKYVMVTAADADRAGAAIAGASLGEKVIWSGRFAPDSGGHTGGVIVLDSTDPEDIRARLAPLDPGEHTVDGWWSSAAVERLRVATAAH